MNEPNEQRACYAPLDVIEWEDMHIDAESAMMGAVFDGQEPKDVLARHIFRLSEEIRRLRHRCGEPVWYGCNTTKEQDAEEKKMCIESIGGMKAMWENLNVEGGREK